MRLGVQLSYAGDVRAALERAVDFEPAGADVVWVSEAYGFDAPTQLGFLAARTQRVQLGSDILPIYSRTPALLAQTAAGLDAVSGGRAILGLGASGPQVIEGWHGVPYDHPLPRTREIMRICRQVWRREPLEHAGACYTLPLPAAQGTGLGKPLKLVTHPVRPRIPIYLAALGDRMVELAAREAEGWLPIFYAPERAPAVWGQALARGLAQRDPSLSPMDVVAGGMVAVAEGDALAPLQAQVRAHLALYIGGMGARAQNFYNDLAGRYGYAEAASQVQEHYLAGRREAAAAALPAELVASVSLVGPASLLRERLAAFRAAGVTTLNVSPIGPNPVRTVEQLRRLLDDA